MDEKLIDFLITSGFIIHDEPKLFGGGFMLPDGRYLDLLKTHNNGQICNRQYGTVIHVDVDGFLYNHGYKAEKRFNLDLEDREILVRQQCIKLQDAMVLTFERPYILLPQNKITDKQYDKLLDWLYDLYSKTYKFVNIHFDFRGPNIRCNRIMFFLRTNDVSGGWYPEEIIKIIKKIYNIAENQNWEEAINEFKKLGGIL